MGNDAAIGGVLAFIFGMLVIGTLIGAIILRAAVSLYNSLAGGVGSPMAVPKLSLVKAIGISFTTVLVNAVAGMIIGLVIRDAAAAAGLPKSWTKGTTQLMSLPISVLVMAGMLTALLPTRFGRALLVTLCYFFIVAVIIGAFVLIGVLALR